MKVHILIAITLVAVGCNNEGVSPEGGNTVHLAGVVDNGTDGGLASYWEDGAYTRLSDEDKASPTSSLFVDGSTVLIGGSKQGSPTRAVLWHDGMETVIDNSFGAGAIAASRDGKPYATWYDLTLRWVFLKDASIKPIIDTAYNFQPTGLALLGEDMYISGNALEPNSERRQHAQVWKNGQLIFREKSVTYAASIFIYKNDIYMAGYLYSSASPNIACYWKNGTRVNLSDGNDNSIAKSVFVTGEHIYAAGMINDQAVYWKDGEPFFLTTDGTNSMANAICVQKDDVHVAGAEHGHPAYWKNDLRQEIENQDKPGKIKFMTVGFN